VSGHAGKTHSGARLRRLREEQKISQAALARRLDLSTSYVNQLENDHRPLTVPVLMALRREFDLAPDYFANDTDARLVGDLSEAAGHTEFDGITQAEIEELVARMPRVGKAMVSMHRRLVAATGELDTYRATVNRDEDSTPRASTPFEEVRDFFYDRKNYIGELDMAAEALFTEHNMRVGELDVRLAELLESTLGIRVILDDTLAPNAKRIFDKENRTLRLARWLYPGQRAFQLATQIALLEYSPAITALLAADDQLSADARGVARIGLANYFAGALLLPYRQFLETAEALRYDIDALARRFNVGFETICHRLSTLQRPDARGVPFIFVRTDSAGNISKRQSATAFHFSRVGGNCPLWVVHRAFAQPGQFLTQVAQMPDDRSYFWLARTVTSEPSHYLGARKRFAIGLGCELAHADRLVYAAGIDLSDAEAMVPIGAGCKICDRPACPQRAFPYLGRPVLVHPDWSTDLPYPPGR
jgi:predicted transcriptional regulator/transcriptional regulator with XRE-family HTH domain